VVFHEEALYQVYAPLPLFVGAPCYYVTISA